MAAISSAAGDGMRTLEPATALSAAVSPAVSGGLESECSSPSHGRPSLGSSASTAPSLPSPPSFGKRSMTSEEELWCPDKMRRVAQATLNRPSRILLERIPAREDLTADNLLVYYAGALVRRAGLMPGRKRLTEKQPPSASELLIAYAAGDFACVDHLEWPKSRDRLLAWSVASKIVAWEYNMGSVEARTDAQRIWSCAELRTKNRWAILASSRGFDNLLHDQRPTAFEDSEMAREVSGCLFTWQTSIGRHELDSVRELLDAGIKGERLVELMSEDEHMQQAFGKFYDWIAMQAESYGFRYFSTCMEVNTRGVEAVAHLHAYLCIDWCQNIREVTVRKPLIQPRSWRYSGFLPHCVPTKIQGNMNAQKMLQMGLFYCAAQKIGSVFRRSNVEPFEDFHRGIR